ncbi:MAG TPA: gluconokinase [Nocardioidaceae bacterium]|nr:gluconokinase [Nocardioidaceae bacterium]
MGTVSDLHWLVVAGVSGSGKTTVARVVAEQLGRVFVDADDLHPAANVDKMRRGQPLSDADRLPWLERIETRLAMDSPGGSGVLACSALRRSYRDFLQYDEPRVHFCLLEVSPDVARRRLEGRREHFMPATLLDSQLATLEPLEPDELGFTVNADPPLEVVVADVLQAWAHVTAGP